VRTARGRAIRSPLVTIGLGSAALAMFCSPDCTAKDSNSEKPADTLGRITRRQTSPGMSRPSKRPAVTMSAPGVAFHRSNAGPSPVGNPTRVHYDAHDHGQDRPDAGQVRIGGKSYGDLRWPLREVGALLEAKAFHPGRTARAHLSAGCLPAYLMCAAFGSRATSRIGGGKKMAFWDSWGHWYARHYSPASRTGTSPR
jgi:hypothetical protein